jgi:hypothetical protein
MWECSVKVNALLPVRPEIMNVHFILILTARWFQRQLEHSFVCRWRKVQAEMRLQSLGVF